MPDERRFQYCLNKQFMVYSGAVMRLAFHHTAFKPFCTLAVRGGDFGAFA